MSNQTSLYQKIVTDYQYKTGKLEPVGEEGIATMSQTKYLNNVIKIKPKPFLYPAPYLIFIIPLILFLLDVQLTQTGIFLWLGFIATMLFWIIYLKFYGKTYFQISANGIYDRQGALIPWNSIELMFTIKHYKNSNALIIGYKNGTYKEIDFNYPNLRIKQISQLCYLHLKKSKSL